MDQVKTGEIIRRLRTDNGYTQKQLAERLNVSDKAVSKWECGNGCPDVSLLSRLADILGTDIQVLLSGELKTNESERGTMKNLKFYVCRKCGNIITAASKATVSCCGSKLLPTEAKTDENSDMLKVQDLRTEWYITSEHEMTKEHYISFVAYICDNSVMMFKQYPEWNIDFTLPKYRKGTLACYCTKCGMFHQKIK